MSTAPLTAGARWRIYLSLGRVSNVPTVWTDALAAIVLAGQAAQAGPAAPAAVVVPLLLGLTLFYTGGMFLNDAFDHDYDREFRPERPVPSGRIGLVEVYSAGFTQLALGEMLLVFAAWGETVRPWPVAGGAVLGLLIVYYNFRHKADILSPLVMALCRAMIYVIAAATVAEPLGGAVGGGIAVLLCYLIGLTYVAKQENLTAVKNLWPVAFLAVPFLYGLPGLARGLPAAVMYAALLAWVLYALSFLLGKERRNIPRTVVSLIAGISLVDGLLVAQAGGPWVWVAACAAGFGLTLYLQRHIAGT
jgi:4-hydroxybenzoate polyprenyltransferase